MTTPEFTEYVEHPRFGRRPRITGDNPQTDFGGDTYLHWHSPKGVRVPGTAIKADTSKQVEPTVAVSHYYDSRRTCESCGRPFLFFAEEQKYWYEELGFRLEADCIRCVPCRKIHQGIERSRQRYVELRTQKTRSAKETVELCREGIQLVEKQLFTQKKIAEILGWLNALPESESIGTARNELIQRARALLERPSDD